MSEESTAAQVDVKKMLSYKIKGGTDVISNNEAIIYSLGLGFSKDPLNDKDYPFTYELHEDFKIFPTYGCVLHKCNIFDYIVSIPGLPNFNPMMLLHGEQRFEQYKALKTNTKYITKGGVNDVVDKGKGLLLVFEFASYEVLESGKEELSCRTLMSLFIRKMGGFGFKGKGGGAQIPKKPTRKPCAVVEEKTEPGQAFIYRLSGDTNPLHVDPNMASMGGFEKPILHGMCFYGLAAKCCMQSMLNNDPSAIKAVQARFTSHVFPGETIIFSYWKENDKIIFSGQVKERGTECIVGMIEVGQAAKL